MNTFVSNCLSVTFVSLCIGASTVLSWALIFEPPWLTYRNVPFPAMLASVRPGEVMPLMVDACNSSDAVQIYRMTRSLYRLDGAGGNATLPAVEVNIATGCTLGAVRIHAVPGDTAPGRYRFVGAGLIKGMMREHTVVWRSEEFVVAP